MEDFFYLLIFLGVAAAILFYVFQISRALLYNFVAFTAELHPVLALLMFIIFPPTFIAFLAGLYLAKLEQNNEKESLSEDDRSEEIIMEKKGEKFEAKQSN